MRNCAAMLLLLGCLVGTSSHAQSWPTRPVTVIVTAAAGGVTDVVARAVGQRLSQMWGQPVVIENKGGAGHILGAQAGARAAPDGHTLLGAEAGTFVLNPTLYTRDKLLRIPTPAQQDVLAALVAAGVPLRSLNPASQTLEALYLRVVRDGDHAPAGTRVQTASASAPLPAAAASSAAPSTSAPAAMPPTGGA